MVDKKKVSSELIIVIYSIDDQTNPSISNFRKEKNSGNLIFVTHIDK